MYFLAEGRTLDPAFWFIDAQLHGGGTGLVYNRQHEAAGIVGARWLFATVPVHHHCRAAHALHQRHEPDVKPLRIASYQVANPSSLLVWCIPFYERTGAIALHHRLQCSFLRKPDLLCSVCAIKAKDNEYVTTRTRQQWDKRRPKPLIPVLGHYQKSFPAKAQRRKGNPV
jgi:hypothetical protein